MLNVKDRAVTNKALNQGARPLVTRLMDEFILGISFGLGCILLPYYDISTLNVTDKLQQGYL